MQQKHARTADSPSSQVTHAGLPKCASSCAKLQPMRPFSQGGLWQEVLASSKHPLMLPRRPLTARRCAILHPQPSLASYLGPGFLGTDPIQQSRESGVALRHFCTCVGSRLWCPRHVRVHLATWLRSSRVVVTPLGLRDRRWQGSPCHRMPASHQRLELASQATSDQIALVSAAAPFGKSLGRARTVRAASGAPHDLATHNTSMATAIALASPITGPCSDIPSVHHRTRRTSVG